MMQEGKPLTQAQKNVAIKLQKLVAVVMAFGSVYNYAIGNLSNSLLFVLGVAIMLALIHVSKKYMKEVKVDAGKTRR